MGTFGYGITQDDMVADIVGFATDQLKSGETLDSVSKKIVNQYQRLLDNDEEPLLWLALAHIQWKYDIVQDHVLAQVRDDFTEGRGLESWSEDVDDLRKRKLVLEKFIKKIESPNPKTSSIPKLIVRKAPFNKGDCLSVSLDDGYFTAALVLGEDNSNSEIGMNLIASLDYHNSSPPKLEDFKRREWLILSHGSWKNEQDIRWYLPVHFRKEKKRISLVGNIPTKLSDPKDAKSHSSWSNLGGQIIYCNEYRKKNA